LSPELKDAIVALLHSTIRCIRAIERCLALLRIFRAKANRIAIQQELITAECYEAEVWKRKKQSDDAKAPDSFGQEVAPFPFIATCLVLGTSFDVAKGYQARVHPLDHNMKIDGGDNNDGITVLDITTPQETRYCFANLGDGYERSEKTRDWDESDGDDEDRNVIHGRKPLLASSYLLGYYSEEEIQAEKALRASIQELEAYPLIDDATLRDLWEGNGSMDEKGLVNVLGLKTSVQTLYLLGETRISLGVALSITRNSQSSVRKVYHSELFRRAFHCELDDHNAEITNCVESLASDIPLEAWDCIAGAIWVGFDARSDEVWKSSNAEEREIDWQKIGENSQELARTGKYHGGPGYLQGLQLQYATLPLQDTIISPTRLVDGILNFRTWMNKKSSLINGLSEISLTFAKSMAVACSARSQPSNEIGPLPGASYMASSLSATVLAAPWPLGMLEMVPGQWTLLIIHEMIHPVFK